MMDLLDGLEKLIDEQASTTMLKESIALANHQYAELEKKFKQAVESNITLEREKQEFELSNYKLKAEISKLETIIKKLEDCLGKSE
jgi:septal ring factor EnvC (AmiA/AmiB activator)